MKAKIEEMTVAELREAIESYKELFGSLEEFSRTSTQVPLSGNRRHTFEVGKAYFIRTITHHYLGIVREICDLCVVLDHCSWVADDGRFHELMKGEWGKSSEREPYPPDCLVPVFYGGMLDAPEWKREVPTSVK